ncbi:MAG TPA: hypothetical protein VE996_03810 [Terriglobales bacterium]|nr:hypothetical protein [Terriglobales bacterium]
MKKLFALASFALAGLALAGWLAPRVILRADGAREYHREPDNALRRAEWFLRGRKALDGRPIAAHLLDALAQRRRVPLAAVPVPRMFSATRGTATTLPPPISTSGSWTELGPSPQNDMGFVRVSGRVTALAVDLVNDPTGNTVYAGTAYGGVWQSTNGLSANPMWRPISDGTPSLAVGALALDASTNPATIYVATGEQNNSIDSYYGVGIMKGVPNMTGGWNWTLVSSADTGAHPLLGLAFARILVDPVNPQILLAAGGSSTDLAAFSLANSYTRGIYRSTDGGQTWQLAFTVSDAQSTNYSCTDLAYDAANKVYYAALRSHGIYKSTDQGQTWTAVAAPSPFVGGTSVNMAQFFHRAALAFTNGTLYALMSDIQGLPATPQPCAAGQTSGCDTGLAASKDGGATWQPVAMPVCGTLASNGACSNSDPLFSNGGADQGFYDIYVAAPPGAQGALLVGGIDVWSTPNATGSTTTWTDLTQAYRSCTAGTVCSVVHPDQHAIAFVNATTWYIGNDGGVWATTDSGGGTNAQGGAGDWANLNTDLGTIQLMAAAADPSRPGIYTGGSQDNGTAGNGAGSGKEWGETWFGDGGYAAIDPTSPNRYFTENSDGGGASVPIILRSDNAGVPGNCTWPGGDLSTCNPSYNPILTTDGLPELGSFYIPYQLTPNDPAQIILGTCRVWSGPADATTADDGWLPISPDLTSHNSPAGTCGPDYVQNLAVAPSDAATIYAVTTDGRVQRTTKAFDLSPAWTDLTAAPLPTNGSLPFGGIAVSPDDPNTAYLGVLGFVSGSSFGHVYKTADGGATWTDITGNLPDSPVNWILVDPEIPNDVYVATDVGVFVITDGGSAGSAEIWQQLGNGLPNVAVLQLTMDPSRNVIAATHGRGAWAIAALGTPAADFTLTSPAAVQTVAANGTTASFTIGAAAQGGFSGTIALSCGSGVTCAFSPASITPGQTSTLTVSGLSSVSTSSVSVQVLGASGGTTHSLNLTVAPGTFSMFVSPDQNSINAGASVKATVTVTPQPGFSGSVALACTGAPTNGTCTLNPTSVTLSGGTPQQATLTVATNTGALPPLPGAPNFWLFGLLAAALAALALAMAACRRRAAWLLPAVLLLLLLAAGCGGGGTVLPIQNNGAPTPPGTYRLTVTATAGAVTRTQIVTVTVQ